MAHFEDRLIGLLPGREGWLATMAETPKPPEPDEDGDRPKPGPPTDPVR